MTITWLTWRELVGLHLEIAMGHGYTQIGWLVANETELTRIQKACLAAIRTEPDFIPNEWLAGNGIGRTRTQKSCPEGMSIGRIYIQSAY